MSITYLHFVTFLQTLLSAVVACFAFIKFRRRQAITKLIGTAFALGFIANSVSLGMYFSGYGKFNNIAMSLYEVIDITLICAIYNIALHRKYLGFILTLFIPFIVLASCNFFFLQKLVSFNSYTYAEGTIVVLLLAVMYLHRLMVELPAEHIHHLPMFWFNAAFLFYRAGSLFLFASTAYLVGVLNDTMITYWFFHNTLSVVEHCLILIGLWRDYKYNLMEVLT